METIWRTSSDDYDIWADDELKGELTNRKLPTEGDREALIARLRADDERPEDHSRMKSYW